MLSTYRKKLLRACAVAAIALLLWAISRCSGSFAEWYALHIFPVLPNTLGRLLSPLPFSLAELLLLALAAVVTALLVFTIAQLPRASGRARLKRALAKLGRVLPLFCAVMFLLFVLSCGVNYHRASIAVYVGIETRPASAQELRQLYDILAQQAGDLALQLPRDSEGRPQLSRDLLHGQARASLQLLGQRYASLAGYYPKPKPLLLSEGMSWLNLTGIYSSFTMEANYNSHAPMTGQPFAVCHELAHLRGYAREDEANFIAYLACLESGDACFRYSGAFQALIYTLNALHKVITPQEYRQLSAQLPEQIHLDLRQNADYWQRYEGQVAEISQNVNNAYLKANSQADGVQSYGRMVDLLLAYYLR